MNHFQHPLALAILTTLALGLSACGGEPSAPVQDTPAASTAAPASSAPSNTAPPATDAVASSPAGASAVATDGACSFDLSGNDAMQYRVKEISVPASCQQFTIHFKHAGSMPKAAMGHNVVIAKTADLNGVIKDGLKAGPAADYVKVGDDRVLAKTQLLGGGESDSLTVDVAALKTAPYSFICTFPGQTATMRGVLTVQ